MNRTSLAVCILAVLAVAFTLAGLNLLTSPGSSVARAALYRVAHRQVSLLRHPGAGGRSRLGLCRHPEPGPRRLLRVGWLCHGHVPHAPDRWPRGLRQPCAAGLHGVPELATPALVLVRVRPSAVRAGDGGGGAGPAGAGLRLARLPQPRLRCLSVHHYPGTDLRAAARVLPQRHGVWRQQRADRLQGNLFLSVASRRHPGRAVGGDRRRARCRPCWRHPASSPAGSARC